MSESYGARMRQAAGGSGVTSFIGVYDVFSAAVAARHFDSLFLSGFSFAASYYGLPDIGFIAWPDILAFAQRVRGVLPEAHLLVDMDDGYCDVEVARHMTISLESVGASGVVLEDQRRPRRCGHFEGKQLLDLEEYLLKLDRVLKARKELFVVARTDASEPEEILRRAEAFARAGADAVLVDALRDLDLIRALKATTGLPLFFNRIAGGKSPAWTQGELADAGVSHVIYSTPCLFAAQSAIDGAMEYIRAHDGLVPEAAEGGVTVAVCNALLQDNLDRRSVL